MFDQTKLKSNIPQRKSLIREEEKLKQMEIERLKIQMLKLEVENRKEAMKYANYQAQMTAKEKKKLKQQQEEAEKQKKS